MAARADRPRNETPPPPRSRRERRILATYLLGHDRTVSWLPRTLARLISAYERAVARAILIALVHEALWFEVSPPDAPFLWLFRRLAFALAGRPRGDDDPAMDHAVPGSGWPGNLLALMVWVTVIGGLVALLRHVYPV